MLVNKLRKKTFTTLHNDPVAASEYRSVCRQLDLIASDGDNYWIGHLMRPHDVGMMLKMEGLDVKFIGTDKLKVMW